MPEASRKLMVAVVCEAALLDEDVEAVVELAVWAKPWLARRDAVKIIGNNIMEGSLNCD